MSNPHVTLFKPQLEAIQAATLAVRAGLDRGLICMPTGTGKTGMSLSLARGLGWPTLFLVHRDTLVRQTAAAAARFWPEASIGVVKGSRDEWRGGLFETPPDLVIGSVQSLNEDRLIKMPRDRFGLLVCDEAHHAPSPSWAKVLDHFEARFRVGVTATPTRLDKKGLEPLFGKEPIYSYSLFAAIADGFLVGPDIRAVETKLDLSQIKGISDFKLKQLAAACNTPERNQQILDAFHLHAAGLKAVTFAVDVDHCEDLAQLFANDGIKTGVVHSKQTDLCNRNVLEAFAGGRLQVLMSCESLTEGFDDPSIECVLMARPTKSRALYIQMIGRGLRLSPGKTSCLVIDFTDNHSTHKLVTGLSLFGPKRGKAAAGLGVPRNPDAGKAMAPAVPILSWKLTEACPWPTMPSLEDYEPLWPNDNEPASGAQVDYLKSFGVQVRDDITRGEASYLLDRCQEFDACYPRPATSSQRSYLEQRGYWSDGMSKRQASTLIGMLKKGEPVHESES